MFGILDNLKLGAGVAIGIPLTLLYWIGIPILNDYPILKNTPLLSHIAVGYIQTVKDDALKSYVLESEKTTVEAKAAETAFNVSHGRCLKLHYSILRAAKLRLAGSALDVPEQGGVRILRRADPTPCSDVGPEFGHHTVRKRQNSGLEELGLPNRDGAASGAGYFGSRRPLTLPKPQQRVDPGLRDLVPAPAGPSSATLAECRGDLRGGDAADDALRSSEERGATGCADAASGPRAFDPAADNAGERLARLLGGVRHRNDGRALPVSEC